MSPEIFWQGLKDGKLLVSQCQSCGRYLHYPKPLCDHCQASDAKLVELPGDGHLVTWTTVQRSFDPGFESLVPYTLVLVALPEGISVMGHLHGAITNLEIGAPMKFSPMDIGDGRTVPGYSLARHKQSHNE